MAPADAVRDAPLSAQDATISDLIAVLLRRKGIILASTALFAGAGLTYSMLAPRLYTAAAAVLLELRSSVSQQDTLRFSFASDSTLVDSQIKIIGSETVLRRVVERENLRTDPEFGTPSPGLVTRLKMAVGLGPTQAELNTESTNAAVEALANALSVRRPERTYVMELNVTARDPKKAARLTNAVAEAYIADQADARGDIARREEEFLESNITKTRDKIRKAEDAVEQYKRANQIVGANGKLVNEQLLSEINTELAQARSKSAEAKSRYDQVRRVIASGRSVESMADALKSPVIDKLRVQIAEIVRNEANAKTTLGERHPQYREIQQQLRDTRRLITEELNRIGEGARSDVRVAQTQEENLERQIEDLKKETSTTNQAIVALRELEREVESNRAVLDNLLKAKGNVTRDSGDMPVARIIARAAPPAGASSPRRIPIMLLSLFAGAALGTIAALLLEQGRRSRTGTPGGQARASRPTEAAEAAEYPVTVLPQPSRRVAAARAQRVLDKQADPAFAEVSIDSQSDYARAVATLATAITQTRGAPGLRKILLVGHDTDERTALFAANLAQALVNAGQRTMVIDSGDTNAPLARVWAPESRIGRVQFANGAQRIAIAVANDPQHQLLIVPANSSAQGIDNLPQLVDSIDGAVDCILFSATIAQVGRDAGLLRDSSIVIVHGSARDGVFEVNPDIAQALEAANSNVLIAVDQAA
ncbi:MAG: GumC family protein [Beijerinckiaceae bacterium]